MRRTRFMSLFFLVLAAAFFCLPYFRQAFELPLAEILLRQGTRFGEIDRADYERWTREAEAAKDPAALAFVALHHPDDGERSRLAAAATAADPRYTWVYFSLAARLKGNAPQRLELARKIQAWEPQNALGYLMEGEYRHEAADKVSWTLLDERAKQTEWRAAMEKAFAAPRYYTYMPERFEVERKFLWQHGAARPIRVLLMVASYPIPNLLNVRQYGNLLVAKLGKDAETANHLPEAMGYYWTAAHFGERMNLSTGSLIEELIGTAVQSEAYKALAPALRKQGQNDAAATVEYATAALRLRAERVRGRDIFTQTANYAWGVFLFFLTGGLVLIFAALTLVAVVYVNAKRWVRPQHKGRLYGFLTTAENYVPILLFAACAGLYLMYYPYAVNFTYYMTAGGDMRDFEALFRNVMPLPEIIISGQLPIGNPLLPYAWYALGGIALVVIVGWATRGKASANPAAPTKT